EKTAMLFDVKSVLFVCIALLSVQAQGCPAETLQERYPRLLIFVSFSMPMATLKQLSQQAEECGGKLVFRGLVKESFKETIPKLKELGSEVLIDPTLFRTYKIDKVPAFVLQKKSPTFPGELVPHDVLYGNVSLTYALKTFADKGEI